jgi:cytidine deaminase
MGDHDDLIAAARSALNRAYAPYSGFRVGAALRGTSGRIWSGCNVENASYGGAICAERVAIVQAVSQGDLAPGELLQLAVVAHAGDAVWPCGFCRQVIEEFAAPHCLILVAGLEGPLRGQAYHRDLLPHAFGPSQLN